MSNGKDKAIVVKRVAPAKKGHHGGAWKLAYADFMTAMMAFFLLMWLLSAVTPTQLKGIADYFNQPLRAALFGGDRSADSSSILKGGGRDISTDVPGVTRSTDGAIDRSTHTAAQNDDTIDPKSGSLDRNEQARLHDLQVKLMKAIEANPLLQQYKQQIRIDSTVQGLRIEIVDTQKRPMFATASDQVEPYMRDILRAIGQTLNDVPNHIVVQGHTDAVPYAGNDKGYSNWELSADRANASRRELIAGGMDAGKVLRVLGLASTQNLNKADPLDPENRRISIIVLNSKSEHAMMRDDSTATTLSNDAATGVRPLAQRFEPPLVKPPASVAGAGGNSTETTLSGAAAVGVKPPAQRLEPPLVKPPASVAGAGGNSTGTTLSRAAATGVKPPAPRPPAQRLEPPILKPLTGAAVE